jgi:hypothetical protein
LLLVSMLLRVLNLKGIISHKYLLPFYVFKKKNRTQNQVIYSDNFGGDYCDGF